MNFCYLEILRFGKFKRLKMRKSQNLQKGKNKSFLSFATVWLSPKNRGRSSLVCLFCQRRCLSLFLHPLKMHRNHNQLSLAYPSLQILLSDDGEKTRIFIMESWILWGLMVHNSNSFIFQNCIFGPQQIGFIRPFLGGRKWQQKLGESEKQ